MGASVMPEREDPSLRLQYYKETGQQAEAAKYEQYLKETGQIGGAVSPVASVRPDVTAALPRSRSKPTGDIQAMFSPGQGRVLANDVAPTLAAHVMSAAQGVPGVRQLQAGIGSAASKFTDNPMTYGQSKGALDELTAQVPSDLRATERAIGGGALDVLSLVKAAKPALRYAPAVGAFVKEMPIARNLARGARSFERARKALPGNAPAITQAVEASIPKAIEGVEPVASSVAKPEGLIGNGMDNVVEALKTRQAPPAASSRVADVVKASQRYRTEGGRLQQGAPQARFDHFAEQMQARQAAGTEAGDLSELLRRSVQHVQKGGALGALRPPGMP